jgi:phosphatidylglycerophosphate synthase
VSAAADALGVGRLLLAAVFPNLLARAATTPEGSWVPLAVVALAAASDFFDGMLARRAGPTAHGAVLDNVADVAFVLAAAVAAAAAGLVLAATPVAIGVAVAGYALASVRGRRPGSSWRLARTRIGHGAGVLNYGLAFLVGAAVATPGPRWSPILDAASALVIAVNVAAVLERVVTRARA